MRICRPLLRATGLAGFHLAVLPGLSTNCVLPFAMADTVDISSPTKSSSLLGDTARSQGVGLGSHVNNVRSLALVHQLQSYIADVEALATERGHALMRAATEQRALRRSFEAPPPPAQLSPIPGTVASLSDLPPRIRAVVEDNRSMKEQLKRTKKANGTHERTIANQQQQIVNLEKKLEALKETLAKTGKDAKQVAEEAKLLEKAKLFEEQQSDLENRVKVLTKSRESDLKKQRLELAKVTKDRQHVEAENQSLIEQLEEKDKELRQESLRVKELKSKLAPLRKSVEEQKRLLVEAREAAAAAAAAAVATTDSAQPATEEQAGTASDSGVHVMICCVMVGNESASSGDAAAEDAPAAEEADEAPAEAEAEAEAEADGAETAPAAEEEAPATEGEEPAAAAEEAAAEEEAPATEGGEEAPAAEGGDAAAEEGGEEAPAAEEAAAEPAAEKKPEPPKGGKPNAAKRPGGTGKATKK